MKLDVIKLDGGKGGSIELPDDIFGIEDIRGDILQRVVTWQLAKRRAGTHKIQVRNEVSRTGKKMYKQKGTGGARHGSRRAAQFVGGAKAHGPVVRSHAFDLPKKVRALALRHALSSKAKDEGVAADDRAVGLGAADELGRPARTVTGAARALLLVHLLRGAGDLVAHLDLVRAGAALGQLPGHHALQDVGADLFDAEDLVGQLDRAALPAVQFDDVEFH